ncbi:MAG: SDR family oxidoreductase [Reyranella sp.]|nr:SDR family oxidoreductase [Reyranella sp.]
MKSVVITGVSTGIGYATAAALCRRGYRVFGSVRGAHQAELLQREWGEAFTPLLFDVTDADAVKSAATRVKSALGGDGLSALVNNAGVSTPGPLSVQSPDTVRQHFEVNVIGVLHAVQAFLPLLRRPKGTPSPPGRIVNISSLSGRIAYPFMGAYAASKHALEALSDSLRRELLIYGVDVIVIEPGAIDTPIWDKAAHIRTTFLETEYGPVLQTIDLLATRRRAMPVTTVTRRVIDAIEHRRPKARYVIPDQLLKYWLIPRMLPDRWLDRIIDKMLNFQAVRDDLK